MGLAFTHHSLHDWLAWLRTLIFYVFGFFITAFWLLPMRAYRLLARTDKNGTD
jgi:hypothetical protein